MSPKVKSTSALMENEQKLIAKPIRDIKEIKETAKTMEQSVSDDEYDDEEVEISPQKYIKVISLTPGQLNLSTLPGGKGKSITFDSFGQQKRIMYSTLVDMMDASPGFLERGNYYIADKKLIRKHGLNDVYDKLLTKEMIENILSKSMSDEDTAILYKSASKTQQGTIIDLIVRKLMDGTPDIDLNMVANISKISGIDIMKRIEDEKFYSKKQETPIGG
jgi:hypothetical protein